MNESLAEGFRASQPEGEGKEEAESIQAIEQRLEKLDTEVEGIRNRISEELLKTPGSMTEIIQALLADLGTLNKDRKALEDKMWDIIKKGNKLEQE